MGVPTQDSLISHSRANLAGLCCLCLGIGMVLWTATWVLVERIVGGPTPDAGRLAPAVFPALPGAAFVLLYLLIRRGVRWALQVAFLACSALAAATAISLTQGSRGLAPIFTLLVSGAAAASAFSALADRSGPSSRA